MPEPAKEEFAASWLRGKPAGLATILMLCLLATSSGCRWTSTGQNTLGVHLYQQGRYNEALQQFQTALSSDPSNPDAYYNLASVYHKVAVAQKDQRLIEQAESLYNQCIDLSPNHIECHRGLAVLLAESGRPDSGLRLLKNWASDNPGASAPLVELARLNQEYGEKEVAERYLDDALAVNPGDYRAWAAKGKIWEETGGPEIKLYETTNTAFRLTACNRTSTSALRRSMFVLPRMRFLDNNRRLGPHSPTHRRLESDATE